jgi:hypothetical protein
LNRVDGVLKEAIGFAIAELPDHFRLEGLAAVIGVWCKGHDGEPFRFGLSQQCPANSETGHLFDNRFEVLGSS